MIENVEQEKRRYARYPIYCPLEYKSEDIQPKEPSTTLNISEGGALISARRDLAVHSNVILKFKLRDEMFFIIGRVKHVRPDESNSAYEIGVEFWDRPKTFINKFYEELDGIKDYQKRYKEDQGDNISLAEASLNWYKSSSC
jgi:hypothetical protein